MFKYISGLIRGTSYVYQVSLEVLQKQSLFNTESFTLLI